MRNAALPSKENIEGKPIEVGRKCKKSGVFYPLNDVPLFFQNRKVEDTAYEKSLYELYQNGEIGVTLDNDSYDGYEQVFWHITKLETYITETERKLNIYFNE